jgi:hypothetical protein
LQFVEQLNAPRVTLPSAEAQLEKRLAEESKLAGRNYYFSIVFSTKGILFIYFLF